MRREISRRLRPRNQSCRPLMRSRRSYLTIITNIFPVQFPANITPKDLTKPPIRGWFLVIRCEAKRERCFILVRLSVSLAVGCLENYIDLP